MSKKKSLFAVTILSLVMVLSSVMFSGNIVFATDYEPGQTYTISNPYGNYYSCNPDLADGDILRGPFTFRVIGSPSYSYQASIIFSDSSYTIYGGQSMEFGTDGTDYQVNGRTIGSYAMIVLRKLSDHTITVNEAEGGAASADKETANLRTTVTLTATPTEGYVFDSWVMKYYDAKEEKDVSESFTDNTFSMPDADVTVTPVFKAIPDYTVSFDANGGSGTMESAKVREGEEYPLPDCGFTAPSGKEFDKWDKGAVGSKITVTEDVVVTAQWKDVPSEDGSDTDSKGESGTDTDSNTDKGSKSDSDTKDSTSPKTGDESNVMFWSMLAILSLGGLTVLGVKRKND